MVYIEIWGPAICHACPAVSITFKDFTRFQIVLRNPYDVKLATQCAVCLHPLTNKLHLWYDFLWSIFPLTIFYSLSLMLFKEWEFLASLFNMQCLYFPAFFHLASPPPCVLNHYPSHYYPVAFQGICAQVFKLYSNRKLTDPHIQQKMWPISIHPCQYI